MKRKIFFVNLSEQDEFLELLFRGNQPLELYVRVKVRQCVEKCISGRFTWMG